MSEKLLKYHLEPVTGAIASGKCRAMLERDEVMSTDETFAEIANQLGGSRSVVQMRHDFETVFKLLIANTLADGRMRRIGDLMETRLDIVGAFDRVDESYDLDKHSLRVNFVGLKGAKNLQRKSNPENCQSAPKGRISAVYSEGGEIGVVHFGSRIVLEGVNMRISELGRIVLRVYTPELDKEADYGCDVVENTESKLVCEWPVSKYLTEEVFVAAGKGKVIRFDNDYNSIKRSKGSAHGRHVVVRFASAL